MITLVLVVASLHLGPGNPANGLNPGIGAVVGRAEIGVYLNSQRAWTGYATVGQEWRRDRWLGLGLRAGVCTGYKEAALVPAVMAYVRVGRVRLLVVPARRPVVAVQVVRSWRR